MQFGDYAVYVDESGDHGLASINPQHPVFVLVFCIVHKQAYVDTVVPSFQRLKFDFWGHDGVVLHSHDIRKARGDFNILLNAEIRARFLDRINAAVGAADFTIIASVINKQRLVQQYASPSDPYEIALGFCMESLQRFLIDQGQAQCRTFLTVERRGRTEDAALELEFRRICAGQNTVGLMPNLEIRFMDKRQNSTGLQLADLVAHPIGRRSLTPQQPNRAYEVIAPKLRRSVEGQVSGYGLKAFP